LRCDSRCECPTLASHNNWNDFKDEIEDKPFPLFTANTLEFVRSKDNMVFVAKTFPLARFVNQEETLKCLMEWQKFCETNGVSGMQMV
jgi:hypothetical protein